MDHILCLECKSPHLRSFTVSFLIYTLIKINIPAMPLPWRIPVRKYENPCPVQFECFLWGSQETFRWVSVLQHVFRSPWGDLINQLDTFCYKRNILRVKYFLQDFLFYRGFVKYKMTRGYNWLALVLSWGCRISLPMQNLFEYQNLSG